MTSHQAYTRLTDGNFPVASHHLNCQLPYEQILSTNQPHRILCTYEFIECSLHIYLSEVVICKA